MAWYGKKIDAIIQCETENQMQDEKYLSKQLLKSITLNRIKADKPSVILISGNSGEGKTKTGLKVLTDFLEMQDISIKDYFNDAVIYTPFEYAQKVDNILTDPRLKKLNAILIDEARGVVKASAWSSYINQAIADINAMSRGVKPLLIIVISQDVGDIDRSTRKTINYEFMCTRPLHEKVRIHPVVYYKYRARGSVEKMELRYRNMCVSIRGPFKTETVDPPTLVVEPLVEEIWSIYKTEEKDRKLKLIRQRTLKIMESLKKEMDGMVSKVDTVFDALIKDHDRLTNLTMYKYGKIRVKKEDVIFHDWSGKDIKDLEDRLQNYKGEVV